LLVPAAKDSKTSTGNGTVFAISDHGHMATAAHVVEGATEIKVYINSKPIAAKVLAQDAKNDVAIIKIDAVTKPIPVAPADKLGLGAELFTIGYPMADALGKAPKFTAGNLTSLAAAAGAGKMAFQISVPIQPGNSGGPVCNAQGEVVGLVRSTLSTLALGLAKGGVVPQNVNFATRTEALIKLAKSVPDLQLLTGTLVGDPKKAVQDSTFLVLVTSKS
jgi:S1-C subfamily serine protease